MLAQISRKRLGNVAATVEICNQYASLSINQSESPAHHVICRRTGTAATSFLRLGRHKNGEASRITVVPDVLTNLRFLFTKIWVSECYGDFSPASVSLRHNIVWELWTKTS